MPYIYNLLFYRHINVYFYTYMYVLLHFKGTITYFATTKHRMIVYVWMCGGS